LDARNFIIVYQLATSKFFFGWEGGEWCGMVVVCGTSKGVDDILYFSRKPVFFDLPKWTT